MTTATQPTYPTLGHKLAAKLHRSQLRRGARPRKRRTTRRPAKPRTDPRVSAFERQLGQTETGRRTLRLVEQTAEARLAEEVAEVGLNSAEAIEANIRRQICAAGPERTVEAIRQGEALQMQHLDAEHELRRWRAEYQRHRGERERLEAEIRHLAGCL